MFQEIDTIVIGGGQAGLVMSYHLNKMGREHVVLERGRVAERWQSQRWNSLHFQFPNWSMGLPGYQFVSDDPNSFSHYSDVARFIGDYALNIKAPVRENSKVLRMEMGLDEKTYKIETENETWITQCCDCDWAFPKIGCSPISQKSSSKYISDYCHRLQMPGGFAARCCSRCRVWGFWLPDRRRAEQSRSKNISVGQPPPPRSSALSRQGYVLVVRGHGPVQCHDRFFSEPPAAALNRGHGDQRRI